MSCPTGKIQYATPQAAARAIKEIKRRNGARVQGFRAGSLMHFQCRRELILTWPSRDLHPNSRVHWSKRSKAAKSEKATAHLLALEAGWHRAQLPDGPLHVWIDGYPTDRRRRDADGLLSSLKPALDGIAEALGVDDRRFVPHPWVKDEVRQGGEVRIRITGGPDARLD